MHGQGTYTFANGHKYTGEFKNQAPNGHGIYIYPDGRVDEGIFKDGIFQYAKKTPPTVTARKSPPPIKSAAEKENEKLRKEIARLKKQRNPNPNRLQKNLHQRSHLHPNQAPMVLVSLSPN